MKRVLSTLLISFALGAASVAFGVGPAGAVNAHANYRAVCPGPPSDSASCTAYVVTDARGNPQISPAPSGYGPAQFRGAYGVSGASSTGTIGIVDAYDDPNAASDLNAYSTAEGLGSFPSCTSSSQTSCFQKQVTQTGRIRADQGWALEISLDVQSAHAMCPACKILLVEAKSNSFSNLLAAEDYATSNANVVSNSWAGSEFSSEASYDSHFSSHPNIPITFSSGDSGYGVGYPAASQYVTAVGGTTLTLDSNNARVAETAWSGSGSGCSAYETKPTWQTDTAGCSRRTVADVSADADPNTGAAVYDSYGYQGQYGWFQVGGTSLSAPLIAAVYALAGNEASTTYGSYPYSHSSSLYDVTSGTNGSCGGSYLCTAVSGYDGPTGLGTPNGTGGF